MNSLKSHLESNLGKWYTHVRHNSYKKAITVAQDSVSICKEIISNRDSEQNSSRCNLAAVGGVLFKGLIEFTEIFKITRSKTWFSHPQSVERSWYLLQNCKERFNYALNFIKIRREISIFIFDELKMVESTILENYGEGVYCSPEVMIKSVECNICHSDFRRCSHVVNNIYDGIICKMVVTDLESFSGVALVDNPQDLRCRIWPWNAKKEADGVFINDAIMMTAFNLQDFLD